MYDLSNYNVETGKDGRVRAYNKINKTVTSYPRIIMSNFLGRELLKTEDVHHKDGNPLNNEIENLEVLDHKEHDRMHATRYFDKQMICPICNKEFTWTAKRQSTASRNRNKKERNNDGPFCSRRCAGINNQRIQVEKGLTTKYVDKIETCIGCKKQFLYTAKMQRERRKETRNTPYCSAECMYKSKTKYIWDGSTWINNKTKK